MSINVITCWKMSVIQHTWIAIKLTQFTEIFSSLELSIIVWLHCHICMLKLTLIFTCIDVSPFLFDECADLILVIPISTGPIGGELTVTGSYLCRWWNANSHKIMYRNVTCVRWFYWFFFYSSVSNERNLSHLMYKHESKCIHTPHKHTKHTHTPTLCPPTRASEKARHFWNLFSCFPIALHANVYAIHEHTRLLTLWNSTKTFRYLWLGGAHRISFDNETSRSNFPIKFGG